MNLNCAKNHELRFVVHDQDGAHWCAMCELEAARQEVKDLKLELSAREYLDHEANIGAQQVNEELKRLRETIRLRSTQYLGLSSELGRVKTELEQANSRYAAESDRADWNDVRAKRAEHTINEIERILKTFDFDGSQSDHFCFVKSMTDALNQFRSDQ